MKTIYKYPIFPDREFALKMPQGAFALHTGLQREGVFVWALVDTEMPEVEVRFRLLGTGEPADVEGFRHVSTWLMEGDSLVWHLFQEKLVCVEVAGYAERGGPDRFDDEDDPL
jgi:hypothetical protein